MAIKHKKTLKQRVIPKEPEKLKDKVNSSLLENSLAIINDKFTEGIEEIKIDTARNVKLYKYESKNFCSEGKYLYMKALESGNINIGRLVWPKENLLNIDDGNEKILLEFRTVRKIEQELLNRSDCLDERNLMKLQNKGADIVKSNRKYVVECIRECEEYIPRRYIHSKLGFMNYEGNTIYKLNEAIGLNSTYVGVSEIKPKGSHDEYIKMIKKYVIGNVELEFALISGLSAILLGYIGEELGLDSIIIHLVGNSTTGKSTALKLAISCFGYPEVKNNGLYGTYNGTNNALIKKLGGLKGVPYAFDEISMSDMNNFTKFIYSLANGADKERLNKDSELMEKESWLTTILSNGEKSITRSSNKNAGVQVRVIEAENFIWTKSSQHADSINHVIINNYGHLAIEFAEYLLNQNKNELIRNHKQEKLNLYDEFRKMNIYDDMSMRRCSKFAILIQTAFMLEEILDIELDIEGMVGMIVNIEKESLKCRNFKESVIDFIKEYVERYRNKFEGNSKTSSQEVLGTITEKGEYTEVQMDQLSFELMIKEGGYEDKKVVLKELKKAGVLDCEKDRLTRSRNNSVGVKTDFIVIKLFK
ncbi:DUF927 domain-containing protein [Paeniclostridium sordellii]|uniref:DUF927 domain-containing protein n=1 Tax=Paraclostridium sordellii TaxID=1505 RepID=UPI0012EDC7BC|nr:DUF927 domain-containing protein [Paeniclostridium sordellii]MDU6483049.1 DUF927 domain-containing protein [Paeniclostridium sordellii]MVO74241.1 DUF927 domain-containing protein [Paeniclostridium sordellii]